MGTQVHPQWHTPKFSAHICCGQMVTHLSYCCTCTLDAGLMIVHRPTDHATLPATIGHIFVRSTVTQPKKCSAFWTTAYTLHRVSKNVPPLACCNFNTYEWILIFFGRNATDKVGNQKTLYYAISNNLCFCTTW